MGIKSSVSLYSLQYQYLQGKMNLDEIMGFVKSLGTDGIELLPDQMLHGTPEPSEETYAMWDRLVKKHQLGLACDDIFLNTNMYLNRELTKRECVDLIKKEIIMANRLGFRNIRLVSMVPAWILEPCLETAAMNDVALSIEIHGGLGFGVPKTEEYIAEMIRLDSPYIGIVPDTSLFMRRPPRVCANYCRELFGISQAMIDYSEEVFAAGTDFFALHQKYGGMDPKLKLMITNGDEAFFAQNLEGYEGYVSTEYEGNRWVLPGLPIPEKAQVAAHQKLVNRLIREIEGQEA